MIQDTCEFLEALNIKNQRKNEAFYFCGFKKGYHDLHQNIRDLNTILSRATLFSNLHPYREYSPKPDACYWLGYKDACSRYGDFLLDQLLHATPTEDEFYACGPTPLDY